MEKNGFFQCRKKLANPVKTNVPSNLSENMCVEKSVRVQHCRDGAQFCAQYEYYKTTAFKHF